MLPFRTDAIAVLAKKGGNEDVTCLCVSVQTQPAPPAEAWPVYVTLQIWPQENLAGEPASSLPPWTVAEGGAVDDGWLTPGERVEVTLERGSNASWMMYVREALVVTAHVINGQGIAADLYIGNKYGYAPWGQGGGVLSVYAEDGPLLTVRCLTSALVSPRHSCRSGGCKTKTSRRCGLLQTSLTPPTKQGPTWLLA